MNIKHTVSEALPLVGGAIGAKLVKNLAGKLPMVPEKLKPAIPLIAGVFLASQKGAMMKGIGHGMIAVGGADLAGSFFPGLNGLEDMDLSGVFGPYLNDDINEDINGKPLNDSPGGEYPGNE